MGEYDSYPGGEWFRDLDMVLSEDSIGEEEMLAYADDLAVHFDPQARLEKLLTRIVLGGICQQGSTHGPHACFYFHADPAPLRRYR